MNFQQFYCSFSTNAVKMQVQEAQFKVTDQRQSQTYLKQLLVHKLANLSVVSIRFEATENRSGNFVWPVKRVTFTSGIRKRRYFDGGNFVVQN